MSPWIAISLLGAAQQTPAPAPETPQGAPTAEQRIARSATLGRLLFLLDRAAWVSSDALTATVPKDQLTGIGGYIVERADDQTLRVTYYRGGGSDARAFFVADVQDGKVVRKELLARPLALSTEQMRLAAARETAAEYARAHAYAPCTPVPFNTVVLPGPASAPILVYLLTAQQQAGTYPMGGNYRVVVGADGKAASARPYSVSCLNLTVPKLPAGAKPMGFSVNHLLDPVPTELHVFASFAMRMPLIVTTPDKRVWQVRGAQITPAPLK